ncbi:uncharacterized protein PV07_07239 [Cladophialophora immunda]|uniref:Uncharacterized protein n=1 Tax=Cladophialophora immunda TaxID=569365 RepID=A0A0D1ZHU3_9EURO|nr:uncharacterized protein PV07_07239 [Cladophialophora immunda]KIW27506.1 hypothetical protein PV07_07239 [Cladophialophora immunda]
MLLCHSATRVFRFGQHFPGRSLVAATRAPRRPSSGQSPCARGRRRSCAVLSPTTRTRTSLQLPLEVLPLLALPPPSLPLFLSPSSPLDSSSPALVPPSAHPTSSNFPAHSPIPACLCTCGNRPDAHHAHRAHHIHPQCFIMLIYPPLPLPLSPPAQVRATLTDTWCR